jgi:hypothetical protein
MLYIRDRLSIEYIYFSDAAGIIEFKNVGGGELHGPLAPPARGEPGGGAAAPPAR